MRIGSPHLVVVLLLVLLIVKILVGLLLLLFLLPRRVVAVVFLGAGALGRLVNKELGVGMGCWGCEGPKPGGARSEWAVWRVEVCSGALGLGTILRG